MTKEKSTGKMQLEKEKLELEAEKVENVFEDQSFIPDQQNRMKGTEPARE